MSKLTEVLTEDLAAEFAARCVSALKSAYAINSERYDQSRGDDRLTFGISVWRNSWFQLEEELAALDTVSTARPEGSLVIRVGPLRVHVYKVGDTEGDDIQNVRISGTGTKDRIVQVNTEVLHQLQLFSPNGASDASTAGPTNLVLAHTGNPFDGLCAAYVGAPTEDEDGPSWIWVENIYQISPSDVRRDEELSPASHNVPYTSLPVAEFDLTLRPVAEYELGPDESK